MFFPSSSARGRRGMRPGGAVREGDRPMRAAGEVAVGGGVEVGEPPIAVDGVEGVGDAFEDAGGALVELEEAARLLGGLALGDVADDGDAADHLTAVAVVRRVVALEPAVAT